MTATAPFVAVLVICVGALVVGSALNGDDILNDAFGGLEAPSGVVDFIVFSGELLLGLGKVLVAIVTADFGWPIEVRAPFAIICDTIIVLTFVGLFK